MKTKMTNKEKYKIYQKSLSTEDLDNGHPWFITKFADYMDNLTWKETTEALKHCSYGSVTQASYVVDRFDIKNSIVLFEDFNGAYEYVERLSDNVIKKAVEKKVGK